MGFFCSAYINNRSDKNKARPIARRTFRNFSENADEGTRTPTVFPPLDPEPSASANSATSAKKERF